MKYTLFLLGMICFVACTTETKKEAFFLTKY